jgi:uncharacterized protein YbdZ (MbtH family)
MQYKIYVWSLYFCVLRDEEEYYSFNPAVQGLYMKRCPNLFCQVVHNATNVYSLVTRSCKLCENEIKVNLP